MTGRPCWSDAMRAAERIGGREGDREVLLLLSQLPLLPARLVGQLTQLQSSTSTYRIITRLREADLVAILQPATIRGHGPALHYLTDLGLATIGLLTGVEPAAFARQHRLRQTDLVVLIPHLPHVLACYELLALLATSQCDRPSLLAWERPFRRRFRPSHRITPLTVTLPAYAELGDGVAVHPCLLYPDPGAVPLRAVQSTLGRLVDFRSTRAGRIPPLTVATSCQERADAWNRLLDQVAARRGVAPLSARVLTWQDSPRTGGTGVGEPWVPRPLAVPPAVAVHREPLTLRIRPGTPLASLARDVTNPTPAEAPASVRLGQAAMRLGPADWQLLDLVCRHPFLTPRQLASVLAVEVPSVRRRRNRLIADRLLRLIEPDEVGNPVAHDALVEAAAAGVALNAAHHGLTPAAAARALGLAGGGPEHPVGQRTALIRQLDHTCGVNGIFVRCCETARHLAATGSDDALVEWRNAAACARGRLRPDAYGVYRHRGRRSGFFLEYDRGTMSRRGYAAKFAAYYAYRDSGRFSQDYDGFPTILVVTMSDQAEGRIAEGARAADVGRDPLPLLLTCQWRIDDPRNRLGLLGPIWREPHSGGADRRLWPHGPLTAPITVSYRNTASGCSAVEVATHLQRDRQP